MSQGPKRSIEMLLPIARWMKDTLTEYCDRVEIAGSIRRREDWCSDIDMVCISNGPRLHQFLAKWMQTGDIEHVHQGPKGAIKWGDKQKSFTYDLNPKVPGEPVTFDLTICTPEEWGVAFFMATGSVGFNLRMVTPHDRLTAHGTQGLIPPEYHFKQHRLRSVDAVYDTPEEQDIFDLFGIEFVQPEFRTAEIVVRPASAIRTPTASPAQKQASLF